MTNTLRVAQVGCGPRAQSHIQAMLESGAVEIVGLCDLDDERLQATGDKFGIERRYHDMAAMIKQEQPALVDIVTPPTIRQSIVEQAIEAGAPALLIEKPMALMPSELRELRALGSNRLIAVNTQYQWMPHWQRFWNLLADGGLGTVRLLRASTRANILEQGPHILDLAFKAAAIAGLPEASWVLAACSDVERFGKTPVPADTSATIGLGEARLHFNAGPSAPAVPGEEVFWYQQQIEVVGDRGRLWVSLNQGWKLWRDGMFESGPTAWPQNDGEAQAALFVNLRDVLAEGSDWRTFSTRSEVAARNAHVLFGCYASALSGKRVSLDTEWPDSIVEQLEQLSERQQQSEA